MAYTPVSKTGGGNPVWVSATMLGGPAKEAIIFCWSGGMAYTSVSKTDEGNLVWVQLPPPVLIFKN